MAIYIEETTNRPVQDNFVSADSRYANSTILIYGDDRRLTFSTYKKHDFSPTTSDKFMIVSSNHEYRPDKTSQQVYGTPSYWWALLEANNISDVFDYKSGLNIRIPSNISDILVG